MMWKTTVTTFEYDGEGRIVKQVVTETITESAATTNATWTALDAGSH
jgi:hypothetical protein